jgi:indolepyruvate ferredoxin oxidoreductase beta subunit
VRRAILLVGVGGQGVLTAAQVLGAAAEAAGQNVVVGQLHGMSQRGGSIECTVKIGLGESTVIGDGEADVVLAFEPLEALRALPRMSARTRVLTSVGAIVPFELVRTGATYPTVDSIVAELRRVAKDVVALDGAKIVGRTGADRTLNAVILGAATALDLLPMSDEHVLGAVLARTAPAFHEANRAAFLLGQTAVRPGGAAAREAQP